MAARDKHARGPRRRFWIGTCNNPKEDSVLSGLEDKSVLPKGVKFIAFQLEKGEAGTPHYQVYLELESSQYLSWLKENIDAGGHWEVRRGTSEEAALYCTKSDTRVRGPWIIGRMSMGKGERTDLVDFRDAIKEGKKKKELWESHPGQMARYRHMYNDYRMCNKPVREYDLHVCLLVGPTGLGKTRTVHDTWKEYWTMPISNGTMWFDGYDLEGNVLIDDFCGARSKVRLDVALRIFDRYAVQVPVKGGFAWWLPTNIAITSNYHPATWYDFTDRMEGYHALCRRIHEVILFEEDKWTNIDDLSAYWKSGMDGVVGYNHQQCTMFDKCQNKAQSSTYTGFL